MRLIVVVRYVPLLDLLSRHWITTFPVLQPWGYTSTSCLCIPWPRSILRLKKCFPKADTCRSIYSFFQHRQLVIRLKFPVLPIFAVGVALMCIASRKHPSYKCTSITFHVLGGPRLWKVIAFFLGFKFSHFVSAYPYCWRYQEVFGERVAYCRFPVCKHSRQRHPLTIGREVGTPSFLQYAFVGSMFPPTSLTYGLISSERGPITVWSSVLHACGFLDWSGDLGKESLYGYHTHGIHLIFVGSY